MKLKNNLVLDNFLANNGVECENHSQNLWIDKYGMLLNYGTIIAFFYNGNLYLNKTKYSATTSKHQNYIRRNYSNVIEIDREEVYDLSTKLVQEYWASK